MKNTCYIVLTETIKDQISQFGVNNIFDNIESAKDSIRDMQQRVKEMMLEQTERNSRHIEIITEKDDYFETNFNGYIMKARVVDYNEYNPLNKNVIGYLIVDEHGLRPKGFSRSKIFKDKTDAYMYLIEHNMDLDKWKLEMFLDGDIENPVYMNTH